MRVTVSSDFVYTPSALSHIYWTDRSRGTIYRANVDGSNIETLVSGLRSPRGIALDVAEGKIYWTDYDLYRDDTGTIHRANVDGSNVETLVIGGDRTRIPSLGSPEGIALDVAESKMYWMDWIDGDRDSYRIKIHRSNMDGSNFSTWDSGLSSPGGIALDVAGDKMYWTDRSRGMIYRGRIRSDSSSNNIYIEDIETLVTAWGNLGGIALDVAGDKMYWTDRSRGTIHRADLDGSNIETLVSGLGSPRGIALDVAEGKMYWTDSIRDTIHRADLDGSNIATLVTGSASGIALGP